METENQSPPGFNELLLSDRDAAFRELYKCATILLSQVPPREMRYLISKGFGNSQDLVHGFILYCVGRDFKVLRKYVPRKRSDNDEPVAFEAWLYTVARNFFRSLIRKHKREFESQFVSIDAKKENRAYLENLLKSHTDCSGRSIEIEEVLAIVKRTISAMDARCRLLLALGRDEYDPMDMVRILGVPRNENKRISGQLAYCRKKLTDLLLKEGIDISLYVQKRRRNGPQTGMNGSERT